MLTALLAFSTYCLVLGKDEGKDEGQAELILQGSTFDLLRSAFCTVLFSTFSNLTLNISDPLYLVDLMDAALSSKHGNDYDAIKCIDGWTNNMCHSGKL